MTEKGRAAFQKRRPGDRTRFNSVRSLSQIISTPHILNSHKTVFYAHYCLCMKNSAVIHFHCRVFLGFEVRKCLAGGSRTVAKRFLPSGERSKRPRTGGRTRPVSSTSFKDRSLSASSSQHSCFGIPLKAQHCCPFLTLHVARAPTRRARKHEGFSEMLSRLTKPKVLCCTLGDARFHG